MPTDRGDLGKPDTPKSKRSDPALPDGPGEPRGGGREAGGSAGAGDVLCPPRPCAADSARRAKAAVSRWLAASPGPPSTALLS